MPHLLFALYPAFGHALPILPVVAELTRRGNRVTAATGADFVDRARAAGAETATYVTSLSTSAPPDQLTPGELAERSLSYLEEILAVSPVLEAACPTPPDALVYDTTLWAPSRVLAAKWGCPSIQLVPTFASNEHFSITDKLGELSTPLDPTHPALVRFGELAAEYAAGHGIAAEDVGSVLAGEGELTIVSIPRRFQLFPETFGDDHVFVGPCLDEVADGWRPPRDGLPVALVSLGTTVNERPELFRQCADAFAGTGWHVVMTIGDRVDPADLGVLPGNVEVHRWIPHGAVLAHASVFVCQGGMGSVQESLYHGVPMVVIPHHPEQRANADRIDELGLGRILSRETVSADLIRVAVTQVAADDGIRARTRGMRDHSRSCGGAARAADEICARIAQLTTHMGGS